jgi:hypothetical protein
MGKLSGPQATEEAEAKNRLCIIGCIKQKLPRTKWLKPQPNRTKQGARQSFVCLYFATFIAQLQHGKILMENTFARRAQKIC